jgi:hypothetical protein
MLRRAAVVPVDISQCTTLPTSVSQLFPLPIHIQLRFRYDFISASEAEDIHTASDSVGVTTVSVGFLDIGKTRRTQQKNYLLFVTQGNKFRPSYGDVQELEK